MLQLHRLWRPIWDSKSATRHLPGLIERTRSTRGFCNYLRCTPSSIRYGTTHVLQTCFAASAWLNKTSVRRHSRFASGGLLGADPHSVERAVNKNKGYDEERQRQDVSECRALFTSERNGQLDGEQSEQSGELDHRVHGDRGSVLEGIADCIADDSGGVQVSSLLLEFDFDDFLGVVPCAAGVGHEDGLIETEYGDRDEIADEVERLDEGESESSEEHSDEDVQHAFLRVAGADLDDFLAVGDAGLLDSFELDVGLDELYGAVGAGADSLGGSAGEPVN